MARVFVIQEPLKMVGGEPRRTVSLAPAEVYGELYFILDWADTRDLKRGREDEVVAKIRERVSTFDPDVDCLLLIGDWTAMALCFYYIAEDHGEIDVLQWDGRAGEYSVLTLNVDVGE